MFEGKRVVSRMMSTPPPTVDPRNYHYNVSTLQGEIGITETFPRVDGSVTVM